MGKLVNVVLYNGKIAAVPEEDAARLEAGNYAHGETISEESSRAREAAASQAGQGIGGAVRSFAEGAADTATFGAYGKARDYVAGGEVAQESRDAAQAHPYARAGGEIAGLLAPTGLLGDAAEGATALSAPGLAASAGKMIGESVGKWTGRAVEGGLIGAGAHVASTNVTGDPLTIEGTVEAAGIGSLLSLGAGVVSDKLTSIGAKATERVARDAVINEDFALAQKGKSLWQRPPDSWQEFTDAVKSKQATQQELFNTATDATEKYDKYLRNGLDGSINKTEQTVNRVSKYWQDDVPEAARPKLTAYDEAGNPREMIKQAAPAGEDTRPVISDEMKQRLQGFRDRIRRIDQLRSGGFELDAQVQTKYGVSQWKKNPAIPPDPARAAEELRSLQTDLRQQFPKATRLSNFKEIPETPPTIPPEPVKLRLPKSLKELSLQKAETAQNIANAAAGDPGAEAAWQKLAQDLGVQPGAGLADGFAGLHADLGKYIAADDRITAAAAADNAKGGVIAFAKKWLKKTARYAAARSADAALGGGIPGVMGRVLAGEGVGAGLTAIEDTQMASEASGTLMAGKIGIENKISTLISKWADPLARKVDRLTPITNYLSNSFPDGKKDPERDIRKLAVNRIGEVIGQGMTAPDNLFLSMDPLMGHPSDAGYKMHQHVMTALLHLNQMSPKDPGLATHMFGSDWLPNHQDAITLAHRIEAVVNPLGAIERILSGDGQPEAAQTLQTVWPNIMQRTAEEVGHQAEHLAGASYKTAQAYSTLFQHPLTGLQEPVVAATLQGLYLPKPEQPTGGGKSGGGGPGGRPPAVSSPVAGSSVTNLIH